MIDFQKNQGVIIAFIVVAVLSFTLGLFFVTIFFNEPKQVKLTAYSCLELKNSLEEGNCLPRFVPDFYTGKYCYPVEVVKASFELRCGEPEENNG